MKANLERTYTNNWGCNIRVNDVGMLSEAPYVVKKNTPVEGSAKLHYGP